MLRELDDDELRRLLVQRRDLTEPPPHSFAQLASRATTRQSVTSALQRLTAFEVWTAEMTSPLAEFDPGRLSIGGVDPVDLRAAVERLRLLGLLWGSGETLRPVRALSAALGGPATPGTVPAPPPPSSPPAQVDAEQRSPGLVAQVAAGSAFELVRRMDVLVEHCDHQPVRLRRDSGVSARDLRDLAHHLDTRAGTATTYLEVARAAGLVGVVAADNRDGVLVPTTQVDAWLQASLQHQWRRLVEAWWERHPASGPAWVKRLAFDAFGPAGEGRVLTAAHLHAWLDWRLPLRPVRTERQVTDLLEQASWLGLTGLGALATYAVPPDASALAALLPGRVDHVLVQNDLTAVAPGPLTPDAAHDLGVLADVESRGGATVYRFTAESLRRARAAGWGATTILRTLEERSRTPLPQPLRYLVGDLDRLAAEQARASHDGQGRPPATGAASAPLRSAPDVSVAPSAWADDAVWTGEREETAVEQSVRLLRAAESPESAGAGPRSPNRGRDVFDTPLVALREAAETNEVVWCGYVDSTGRRTERQLRVTTVDDGQVEARDVTTDEPLRLALPRITAAHILRPTG